MLYQLANIKQLRYNGFILVQSLRVQPIMVGKAWLIELEAAGHIASIVRKQSVANAGTPLAFFPVFSQGP